MNKINTNLRPLELAPLLVLIFCIVPLAIIINPQLIPRFLGETSHISQYGYLDLEHYIDLALQTNKEAFRTAFFPLWPTFLRILNSSIDLDIYKIAIFTSSIIGIISFIFSKFVIELISLNKSISFISWTLYVLSPMTIFFFAGYTESIFAFVSWLLILCIINILNLSKRQYFLYWVNCFILLIASITLALTRPILLQTLFSLVGTNVLILVSMRKTHKKNMRKYIDLSVLIFAGSIIGYIIYGTSLVSDGFRFFEPFFAQETWNKSFGIRPVYLFTSRSSLIDLWGLYYPVLLFCAWFNDISYSGIKLRFISSIFFQNFPLTLLYPPAGFFWGLFSSKFKFKNHNSSTIEIPADFRENKIDLAKLEYIFLFAILFSISHSLICFLTQPLYMRSLGRYVFGQPYFYVALTIFLNTKSHTLIRHKNVVFTITILTSSIYLLKNFVEFGYAKLSP